MDTGATARIASNKRMHANRRLALQFRCDGLFGRCIRCHRPSPAAVGDPTSEVGRATYFLVLEGHG